MATERRKTNISSLIYTCICAAISLSFIRAIFLCISSIKHAIYDDARDVGATMTSQWFTVVLLIACFASAFFSQLWPIHFSRFG